MSIGLAPVDLSSLTVGTGGKLDWTGNVQTGTPTGTRAGRSILRMFNESGAGLLWRMGVRSDHLPAGGWADVPLNGEQFLSFTAEYILPGAPVALLLGTIYEPGEPLPPIPALGNSPIGIGGTVQTGGSGGTGTAFIKNDGNAPGSSTYEATPSDQATSSISENNDGSGFRKILSANVLRTFWNIVRGNATTGKASIQLGDSGDTSILTLYGQVGAGSAVPASTITGTLPASQVGAGYPGGSVSGTVANATNATNAPNYLPLAGGTMGVNAGVTFPRDTTSFNQLVQDWKDSHSGSDWQWILRQDGAVALYDNAHAVTIALFDASGFITGNLGSGANDFQGCHVRGSSHFSGTGAGTFNHNLPVAPNFVAITSLEGNSTETVGVDSITSTTVHVNQGQSGWPWTGFATAT